MFSQNSLDELFFSWLGAGLTSGQITKSVQRAWSKAGLGKDITLNIVRKTAVSSVHQAHPKLTASLADLMCHRQSTAQKCYRLVKREHSFVAASKTLTETLAATVPEVEQIGTDMISNTAVGPATQTLGLAVGLAPQIRGLAVGPATQTQGSTVGLAPQTRDSAVGPTTQAQGSAVGLAPQTQGSAVGSAVGPATAEAASGMRHHCPYFATCFTPKLVKVLYLCMLLKQKLRTKKYCQVLATGKYTIVYGVKFAGCVTNQRQHYLMNVTLLQRE